MAGVYHCVVSGNGEAEPVRSENALLYAIRPTKITRQPDAVYVHQGEVVTFQIDMHITPEEMQYGEPFIQWYRGNTPLQDNDRIAGANSSILTIRDIKPIDFANNYYVVVKGLCGADTSLPISIIEKPNVVIQPIGDVEACEGETVQITVNASSTVPGYNLVYQWRFNGSPINDNAKYSGTNTETLTISNLAPNDAGTYDVVVTIPGFAEATSNQANLVVYSLPKITSDLPATYIVSSGQPIVLTIGATGDNLSYQWYKDDQEINFTQQVLEITSAQPEDAGTYKVKVYNQCGEVWSSECVVTVTFKAILDVPGESSDIQLYQNKPNPFESITRIEFALPEQSVVKLSITNAYGETLAEFNGKYSAGLNFIELNADQLKLVPGVYFYTLEVNGKKVTRKMLLIK